MWLGLEPGTSTLSSPLHISHMRQPSPSTELLLLSVVSRGPSSHLPLPSSPLPRPPLPLSPLPAPPLLPASRAPLPHTTDGGKSCLVRVVSSQWCAVSSKCH